jgi:hypothetical protein
VPSPSLTQRLAVVHDQCRYITGWCGAMTSEILRLSGDDAPDHDLADVLDGIEAISRLAAHVELLTWADVTLYEVNARSEEPPPGGWR